MLLGTTLVDAWPVLSTRLGDFVTSNVSQLASRAGVRQGIVGSLILIGFVAVVAMPLGIAAAIYLQEYARDTRLNRLLTTNIRNLAGVPSIVYGILGLVVFVQALRAITGPDTFGRSYISGGTDAGGAGAADHHPRSRWRRCGRCRRASARPPTGSARRGGRSCAATCCPTRRPGVFTGTILSLARAFGETAPLLLVGAVTGYLSTPSSAGRRSRSCRASTRRCRRRSSRGRAWPATDWKANTAAAIVVLLVIILVVNLVAILLRNRYDRKW